MSQHIPHVSIGLPVFNGEKYLKGAIQSILDQTYTDFELIICDNCSTDQTQSICKEFAQRDSRVRYHRNAENVGANPNFNLAVTLARGKYFKWAAHDDLLHPTYLERVVARLDANPAATLCYTYTELIDRNGDVLTPLPDRDHITDKGGGFIYLGIDSQDRKLTAPHASTRIHSALFETHWTHEIFGLMRTDALRKTPILEPVYGSDKVLLAELAAMGPFEEVPEKLFLNRRHPEQSVSVITTEGRSTWSDPRVKKGHSVYSRWLRLRGYVRAALRVTESPLELLKSLIVVFSYYFRVLRWRIMLEDLTGLRMRRLQKEMQEFSTVLLVLFFVASFMG